MISEQDRMRYSPVRAINSDLLSFHEGVGTNEPPDNLIVLCGTQSSAGQQDQVNSRRKNVHWRKELSIIDLRKFVRDNGITAG